MPEYQIDAKISKLEAEVIKQLRKVQSGGWGRVVVQFTDSKCVQLEVTGGIERSFLMNLQK